MSTHIPPKEGSNLIPKKNPARTDDQDRQTKPLMVPSLSVARLSAVPLKPLPSLSSQSGSEQQNIEKTKLDLSGQ